MGVINHLLSGMILQAQDLPSLKQYSFAPENRQFAPNLTRMIQWW